MSRTSEVDALFAEVERAAEASFDSREIEPALKRVVLFAHSHPDSRPELVAAFLSQLEAKGEFLPLARPGAVDVLEFCMHDLRWPEVRGRVSALLQAKDLRVSRAAERVLEAFDDDWPTGDIYATYDA